jgi:hypothetical protein
MNRQRLLGVVVVVIVLGGLFLFFRGDQGGELEFGEGEEASVEEVTSELSQKLGVTVAEDVERVSLRDINNEGASALATRNYTEGRFMHTILAALPDVESGEDYQGWLVRGSEGDEDYSVLATGVFTTSKGGYLLEFSSSSDLRDHDQVWITSEVVDDGQPGNRMLEGSF